MRIVVTSGPSFTPLDKVRRLTNFSTGELGTLLAEAFAAHRHTVLCFRGVAATFASPLWGVEVVPFSTNDHLAANLERIGCREQVNFVFHVAALTDFVVREVTDADGHPLTSPKFASTGPLQVTLDPAPKVLAGLRRLFPASILVGWKYELEGTASDLRLKARQQMEENLTDACVLNGPAYGSGFGFLSRTGEFAHLPHKQELCRFLVHWAEHLPQSITTPGQESFHALSTFIPLAPFI